MRASGGTLVAVPDLETENAAGALSRAGLPPEFTSATALAALMRLARAGGLRAKSAVLVLTARERSAS